MKHFHYRKKQGSFFEGWYLKHQTPQCTLAFAPAFHMYETGESFATLRIIKDDIATTIALPVQEFKAEKKRFYVEVGDNVFTHKGIKIRVDKPQLKIHGQLEFGRFTQPRANIMGSYKFAPFLGFKMGILSLYHELSGSLSINGEPFDFTGGMGYIEHCWGSAIPSAYIYTQCSWQDETGNCIMAAAGDIPFLGFTFTGCVCIIRHNGREYRVCNSSGAKLLKVTPRQMIIKQGKLELKAELILGTPEPLRTFAKDRPQRLSMKSPRKIVRYTFANDNKIIFNLLSDQADFEFVEGEQI